MPLVLPNGWRAQLDAILSSPGVVVVVGDVDTGKTSFCTLLANEASRLGVPAAVVDGDIGQSEIGPPTTQGLGLVDAEIGSLGDLEARSLYFVGNTSPFGHLLDSATGLRRLTDEARALGRQLVIVDTTGLVRGAVARKLKTYKIELLGARHVVALQKAHEAEHFLRFFDTWRDCTVHRLQPAPGTRAKGRTLRTQRRAVRFREYFMHAREHEITLESVATSGAWLRTGDPLETRYLKFAESALRTPVLYGERIDRGVFLVAKGDYDKRGVESLQEEFKTRSIAIVISDRYLNLVVGLHDERLKLVSLGIVKAVDYRAGSMSIFSPLRSVASVRSVRFGDLKLRPDGTEIGRLRPGEL